jgi:hypothetical protein
MHSNPGERLAESVRVEPYRDETLGFEDGFAAPEARFQQREAVGWRSPPRSSTSPRASVRCSSSATRSVLSAKEVSESLGTTVASVNSALQRARKAVDERLPEEASSPRSARWTASAWARSCSSSPTPSSGGTSTRPSVCSPRTRRSRSSGWPGRGAGSGSPESSCPPSSTQALSDADDQGARGSLKVA